MPAQTPGDRLGQRVAQDRQDRLGHSTITAAIYQHHVRRVDEDVADKLDDLLRPRPAAGTAG